jgi:thiamine biosynthesis lipoprotein
MAPQRQLNRRARVLLPVLLLVLVGLSVDRLLCAEPPGKLHELSGPTMGTRYSVKLPGPLQAAELARIDSLVKARLDEVNRLMSTYDPGSELSRFNAHRSRAPFPVSAPTLDVFRVARDVSERSEGALDVTVGPLVEAWGFGASARPPVPPDARQLERLRARVGFRRVRLDADGGSLSKADPETVCDLSAVAKGFAVDRIAEALLELGHPDFLVEVGGELRGHGERPGGGAWRVAIEAPDPEARRVSSVIELRNLGMATSGDYRNFYEQEGVWLSHLIDPRTGQPIRHDLASVTVLHPDAALADAWATALIVLGPQEGRSVVEREGLMAHFIERDGAGGFRTWSSPAFTAATGPRGAGAPQR